MTPAERLKEIEFKHRVSFTLDPHDPVGQDMERLISHVKHLIEEVVSLRAVIEKRMLVANQEYLHGREDGFLAAKRKLLDRIRETFYVHNDRYNPQSTIELSELTELFEGFSEESK